VRASTLSLGSIAFGSLIVTVLEVIRLILQSVQNAAAQDDNRRSLLSYRDTGAHGRFLSRGLRPCLLRAVLRRLAHIHELRRASALMYPPIGCLEGMVNYFNRYAYIEIALYGKPVSLSPSRLRSFSSTCCTVHWGRKGCLGAAHRPWSQRYRERLARWHE
jgi:hypothetical protein